MDNKLDTNEINEHMDIEHVPQTFMSFQVKDDMKIAPVNRRRMNHAERSTFEDLISSEVSSTELYLEQFKKNKFAPRKTGRTWSDDDDDKSSNADDLFIIGKKQFLCTHKHIAN